MNVNELNSIIELYSTLNMPFQLSVSNYTATIETEKEALKFVKKERGKLFFAAHTKIMKDINEGFDLYEVDKKFIQYYNTNFNFDSFYADKIYQLDIRSCYPNILLNKGIIKPNTFEYLQGLKKEDRLAAIGMLARSKYIYNVDNKGQVTDTIDKGIYSDYFFFCVQETFKIMEKCNEIMLDNFLFSWVDAIYFTGGLRQAVKVQNYLLSEHKLQSTFSELHDFEVTLQRDCYKLTYIKDDLPTYMCLPLPQQPERIEINNIMLSKKYNNKNPDNKNAILQNYINKKIKQ